MSLSLRQKIAQLLMVGFEGSEPTAELEGFTWDLCPGSVILFGRNVSTPAGITRLLGRLQAASRRGCEVPLLVAVDQEGGPVTRLREGFSELPGQARLGELPVGRGEQAAYAAARKMGEELAAVGISLNLAPVLDVRAREDSAVAARCFSADPERVAALGAETIRGLQEAGVAACGKHFPGHGDTPVDSHLELPVIEHGLGRLEAVELAPFRTAIKAGVAAVMTTHILYPALDDDLPATLSARVVSGLLRDGLGFGGLILSDDLQMGAIIKRWGLAQAAELALRAGCDQLLVCNMLRYDDPGEVVEHLERRARSDPALAARVEESLSRILAAKERWVASRPGQISPPWEQADI